MDVPSGGICCSLCGATKSRRFSDTVWRGITVRYRICSNCGFVFQSPRMTGKTLEEYYRKAYREQLQGTESPTVGDAVLQDGRARSLLQFLARRPSGVSRHLDIGCSYGSLIGHFQKAFGCQSVGVEPGDAYRRHCSEAGIEVYPLIDDLKATAPPRFDLVSMVHVLEHLDQPREYLRMLAAALLADDGHILVEVPNLYGHPCFEVAHMYAFSRHTLEEMLRSAGFRIVAGEVHGRPRGRRPYYVTVLARRAQGSGAAAVRPERWVWAKRQAGIMKDRLQSLLGVR